MTHSISVLSPVRFLDRAAAVHGDRTAVVDDSATFTYRECHLRSHKLAGALVELGVRPGARVAVLAHNTRALLEAHYGVPYAGAVLVPLNPRLNARELAAIVTHSGSEILIATEELTTLADQTLALVDADVHSISGSGRYESLIADAGPIDLLTDDEYAPLAINYTSGTTGTPKGVVYTHRGAYLQSLAMAFHSTMTLDSSYLWTLPMFHCNGWCFTWAVTAVGASHVCLPSVDAASVWTAIAEHTITHMCAAPTVLSMITAEVPEVDPGRSVWVATGGAPPAPALLARARASGLAVTHLYGMTETYGPVVINEWQHDWNSLPERDRDRLNARQGVANIVSDVVRVVGAEGRDVPSDATSVGEIALRGNTVTPGYYLDPAATRAAVPDGWFRSGDLAVRHPDGYLEIRDRAKDIIISGGENISSVEIERALLEHPAVLEAAVVAAPDEHWGERPYAFVSLRPGQHATSAELRTHLRDRLAKFKIPDHVEFADLPKTATGKIQKFALKKRLS